MLTTSLLGTLEDERSIWKYRIINSLGEYAEILNYGVCLHALYIWDNQGNLGSVILGAPDVEALEYRITIGRCIRIRYHMVPKADT